MKKSSRIITIALAAAGLILTALAAPSIAAYSKSAPSGLKAMATSNTSIVLTWKYQSGVSRYAIQYSRSSKFTNPSYRVPTGVSNQAEANAAVRGLEPGTKYYFRIRSTSTSGSNLSAWSKSYSRTTSTYVYGAPGKPSVSDVMKTSAKLSWSEIPNSGQYRVEVTPSGGSPFYRYFVDNSGVLTGLNPSTKYSVRVRALESKSDDNGNPYLLTGYSSAASFTTNTFTQPTPADVEIAAISKDKITVRWTATPGATSYRIQHKLGKTKRYMDFPATPSSISNGSISQSGNTVTAVITKWCDSFSGSCSSFKPGSKYYYRVTALAGGERITDYTAGNGPEAIATDKVVGIPLGLKVEDTTASSITLSWPKVDGAHTYGLQQKLGSTKGTTRYLSELCPANPADRIDPNPNCAYNATTERYTIVLTNFAQDKSLVSDPIKAKTSYYFRVTSQLNKMRASDYFPSYTKATTSSFAMQPPNLGTESTEADAITLKWATVPGATAYVIDRSTDSEFGKIDYASCLEKSYMDSQPENSPSEYVRRYYNLQTETSYFFRIRVVNNCTNKTALSDNSKPMSARTTARTGTITGRVTNGGGVSNFSSVLGSTVVTAYSGACTTENAAVADTEDVNADGTFTLGPLRGGSYCVAVSQTGDANVTSPWAVSGAAWNDERRKFKVKASTYVVFPSAATSVGDVPVGVGRTFSGTVRNSGGTPLKDATVTMLGAANEPTDKTREVRDVVLTNASGQFSFTGLFPGKYRVDVARTGYDKWRFYVAAIENHPTLDVTICNSSSCTPSPGYTQYD